MRRWGRSGRRERESVLNFGTHLWTPVVILVSEFCEEIETHFFIWCFPFLLLPQPCEMWKIEIDLLFVMGIKKHFNVIEHVCLFFCCMVTSTFLSLCPLLLTLLHFFGGGLYCVIKYCAVWQGWPVHWLSTGQPYNQLAILEVNRNNKLSSVFYYVRSLAVRHPFPVAATNLEKFYTKLIKDTSVTSVVWSWQWCFSHKPSPWLQKSPILLHGHGSGVLATNLHLDYRNPPSCCMVVAVVF